MQFAAFFSVVFLASTFQNQAQAACGGTVRTWDSGAGSANWSAAANWSADDIPNTTTEDVVIVSGAQIPNFDTAYSVGCLEIQSGTLTANRNNRVLTINGDYFRNLTANSFTVGSASFTLKMGVPGSPVQTLENYDLLEILEIGNNNTVTSTKPFRMNTQLQFTAGWTGTLKLNGDLDYRGGAVTIPAGGTVIIGSGVTWASTANITVAGTLKIMPGATLKFNTGRTLTVNNNASLIIAGASGNSGKISGQDFNDSWTFNMNGILNADYFLLSRMAVSGLNIGATGIVQKLDNGEFHYPQLNGDAIRVANGATLPATMNQLGFSNDANLAGTKNFNSAYTGTAITVNNWTGNGNTANERADTGNKILWGAQGGTKLSLVDFSNPPATINQATTVTGGTFSFALNQASTLTNITSIKISMLGTATTSDIDYITVYADAAGSMDCVLTVGTDTVIANQVSLSSSPLSYTVAIASGVVTTSSDTAKHCIHVQVRTTGTAQDNKTIRLGVQGTNDVVNSQGYTFSDSAAPPVLASPDIVIVGDVIRKWQGDISTAWSNAGNWSGGVVPTGTRDCQVGVGTNVAVLDATGTCQVANFLTGGTLNFNATGRILNLTGGINIDPGFIFQTPTNVGTLNFSGAVAEGVSIATPVPAHVTINNTGAAGNDYVEINGDTTIGDASGNGGNVTVTNGTLRVNAPYTLTIKGNLTCAALAGNGIEIAAGATLKMGNNRTITINNGCTFTLVGNINQNVVVTSDNIANSYNVIVAAGGIISANYYKFENLGTLGLNIAGTINATNHLQNGTFRYPRGNNGKMLDLDVAVPTNSMDNMTFTSGGSSATGTTNIDTATNGAGGTLTLNNYTGDLAGPFFDNDPTYLLAWLNATNTIEITQEATSPVTLNAGSTYNMGRFGFKQAMAGASFVNTDITSLRLTLTGTASSNDISDVKIYYDATCAGAGGVLVDSGAFSGNPASRVFTFTAGEATVNADTSTPPKKCLYVEYVIASGATDGNTAGVELVLTTDFASSAGYAVDSNTLPPLFLGSPGTISGSSSVNWVGGTSTNWNLAANWSPATVPTSGISCRIDSSVRNPTIDVTSGNATCKTVIIGNGTLNISTGYKLSVYGGYTNTGTLNLAGTATLEFADGGVLSNQTITSSTTIGSISFAKTAGGNVNIGSSALTVTSLVNMQAGQNFDFLIPSGKNLTFSGGATVSAGTFTIAAGGTLTMGNATAFTVGANGTLIMIGSSGANLATMTGGSNKFNAVINGTIKAQYYKFDHLSSAGVSVESGSTIDVTYHLQDGSFTYPVDASTTMLFLKRQVPTDTMDNTKFDKGGSAAATPKNINTTGAAAGTLTMSGYLGDIAGDAFEVEGSYTISWGAGVNTINLTQSAATALGSVTAPSTANLMGRFGFKQTLAGASYSDAALTTLKLTLKGTAIAADVSEVRIYYETDCNSAGGTLIGSGIFSGSPGTATFNLNPTDAIIPFNATTPPTVCIYVQYDIPSGATNGNTVGVEVAINSHVTNDQAYAIADATPVPVNLGTAIAISGAINTTWNGSVSTAWGTAGNWSAGVPTSTVNCTIPTGLTVWPNVAAGTIICKSVTLQGSMTMSAGTWDVHGDFINTGTFTNSGGALNFQGTANQNFSSGSTIFNVTFGKTAGTVAITGASVPITSIDFTGGSAYTFKVNSGRTVTFTNNVTVLTGKTFDISAGTVRMSNGRTFTINSGATLNMIGTSAVLNSVMTSTGGANAFNVVIAGTIAARYFTFDHLGVAGVAINGTATINATNQLQDCNFTYPVNNNTKFLTLAIPIPVATLDNCKFDLAGSVATGTKTIDASAVTGGAPNPDLTLNNWSGDAGGTSSSINSGTYTIAWAPGLNTINITREAASPTTVNAGTTYNMGRFGFQQVLAGTYADTDITTLRLSTTGTAVASDISQVRVYYDSDCNNSAGTLIGTGAFAGSPLTKTFTFLAGDARIHFSATSPPLRCIYVEMDVAPGAVNARTISAKIDVSADLVNSLGYAVATAFPVALATTPSTIVGASNTTWTGTTSTAWNLASNWTSGIPDSTKTCTLVNVANDPIISTATQACRNVSIGNGILTINTGSTLQVYGNYDNTSGSVTMSGTGTVRMMDGGTGSAQTVASTAQPMNKLTFDKTTGGSVRVNSTMTITNLTIPAGSNFTFQIPASTTLTLTNGLAIPAGTVDVQNGGTILMASGTTLSVTGGTFKTSGVNDTFVQSSANKGKVSRVSGSWSFNATSGTVNLTGFWLDYLDANGMQINGSTTLSNLSGGQFTNLATNGRGMQVNTSGAVPATAANVGFEWGAFNAANSGQSCLAGTYYTVYATACGGNTITFTEWWGNWWPGQQSLVDCSPDDHIWDSAEGASCTISMASSASPVSLLSLVAKPYNHAVSIEWVTASELDHQGFNVYRSLDMSSGFIQINSELVRNIISSTSYKGKYRFVDHEVENGTLYYYIIEDVAFNGAKEKHGPVSARPLIILTAPPADPSDTNSGTTDPNPNAGNDPSTGPIATPGMVDLGNGVHILAQTKNSLRIEIIPPPETWANSTWNATYKTLKVPGYSNTLTPGYPELVDRTILVEVSDQHSSALVINSSLVETVPVAKKVQPAPNWVANGGGILQASYAENAVAYSAAGYQPATYYSLDSALKTIGGKTYLALNVSPFKYDAVNQLVKNSSKIVLDIALDGEPIWNGQPPTSDPALSPSAADGVLRIGFRSSGLYELTYNDFVTANVDGPFAGHDSTQFRMYVRGEEIPISIISTNSTFSSGDKIRYHVDHLRNSEDDENEVVLSSYNVQNSASAPLRMDHRNAEPTSFGASPEVGSYYKVAVEQDVDFYLDYPLGPDQDHFFWKRIKANRNGNRNPYPTAAKMDIPIDLTRLDQNSTRKVYLRVYLRARANMTTNASHHLGLYLNNITYMVDEKVFTEDKPTVLTFELNPNFFFDGINTIKLLALGDMVPENNWDIIDIDRVEVEFEGSRLAIADVAEFTNRYRDQAISVFGFSSTNVVAYDVSQQNKRVSILDNIAWSVSGGLNDATFATVSNIEGDMGTHYVLIKDGQYKKPTSLLLQEGIYLPLKSSAQGADLIIVGPKSLLSYTEKLVSVREGDGLRVVSAPLEQIYAEFSDGLNTSRGVRDFILYAYNNWTFPKPKYLLIIGDATYDPLDKLGYGRADKDSMTPLALVSGIHIDFGSDNYFVANPDGTDIPIMSVGRIPTSQPDFLEGYINKILAYEVGSSAPSTGYNSHNAVFINDKPSFGDNFSKGVDELSAALYSSRPDYTSTKLNRELYTDVNFKQKIIDEFNSGPFLMTYLGHGAEERWMSDSSGNPVFGNTEAKALTNARLPIVLALNCLNSYFYDPDPDPSWSGLGEELILNANGGAIAFWGSTAMTTPGTQKKLATSFINEFSAETTLAVHDVRLGDILSRAKQVLGSDENSKDTIRSWALLGDPSMKLPSDVFKAQSVDQSSTRKSKGFLSCGSIDIGSSGGSGPNWPALFEMLLLVGFIMLLRIRLVLVPAKQRIKR